MKHVKSLSKAAPATAISGIDDIVGMVKDFFTSILDMFSKDA